MIKCNQCGKMNAAGAVNCQLCGAPLSNTIDGGMSPRTAAMEQPELPAWLESLRAGERSAAPANSGASFSPADFSDEDSLPSWMRAERNETRDNTGANPRVSIRSSSLTGPTTNGDYLPQTGISAQSLLDEQSLPTWMRDIKPSGSAQEKIPASNLVQSENVPDWMKALQGNQAGVPGPSSQVSSSVPQVPASPQRSTGVSPSGSQSAPLPVTPPALSGQGGFSARDLVDPQSLPSWMTQQGGQAGQGAQSPQAGPARTGSQSAPLPVTPPALSGQGGFSARDLVDPQSLPSWMTQQGGQAGQGAQSSQVPQPDSVWNAGQPASGQTFPASSLLDANSLPSWLQEQGGQTQTQAGSLPSQPFQAPSASASAPMPGGTVPASSFLDANSMPAWTHQAGPQQPNSGFGATPQPVVPQVPRMPEPHVHAGPPRVENVRVPNRPRNEINPNETSEVAANVFASVLGVASSTPKYPASAPQSPSSYQQPGFSGNAAQPNMGYPMGQSGMAPSGSGNYARPGMGAIPNTPGASSNMPQGYAPGNSYGNSYRGGMGSAQMGYSSAPGGSPAGQRPADANERKGSKKRGLFGAILEWLAR